MAIVGYMGSGKSTVGRLLARRTGRDFVDVDDEISRRAGRSIPEIFAESGEEGFRDLEQEALRDALNRPRPAVISCGGGSILRGANREALNAVTAIFLGEDLDTLYARTRGPNRPLRGVSRAEFDRRYAERLPLYREVAEAEFRAEGRRPSAIVEEVALWLHER